jgi:PhnB protein
LNDKEDFRMQAVPYLFFNGECARAMAFYADVFGGEVGMSMPASEMPPEFPVPEDRKGWVMHTEVKLPDGGMLYGSDNITGTADAMAGSAVMVSFPDLGSARAAWDRLIEGGQAEMPFSPTFWSAGFGVLVDRYHKRWMIGTDEEPSG